MIIGIIGKARSGKDTFAEYLAEEIYNKIRKRFVLMAYAHELKLRVQRDFDLSYDQLWGDKKEEEDRRYKRNPYMSDSNSDYWTPREIMQSYGEFFRSIDVNFWVNNLFRVIEEKEYRNVIITDARHINEVVPISDSGGYIIKVDRTFGKDMNEVHGKEHISEVALDNYSSMDFVVSNNGSLDELRSSAKDVVSFILEAEKLKKNLEVT